MQNQQKPNSPFQQTDDEKKLLEQKRLLDQELNRAKEDLKKDGRDTFVRRN